MRSTVRGWLAFGLGAAGVCWSLLLVAAAFYVPAYQGLECGSAGCTTSSTSLVAENGLWVAKLLLLVALVAFLTFSALHVRCATGSAPASGVAVAGIVSLALFSFVTGFSIGLFVFPVVLFLIASAVLTPERQAPPGR